MHGKMRDTTENGIARRRNMRKKLEEMIGSIIVEARTSISETLEPRRKREEEEEDDDQYNAKNKKRS